MELTLKGKFPDSNDKKEEEFIDVKGYSSDEAEEPMAKRLRPAMFRPWESSDSAPKKSENPSTTQIQRIPKTPIEQSAQSYNRLFGQSAQLANLHFPTPRMYSSHYSLVNHSELVQPLSILPAAFTLPTIMMTTSYYKLGTHQSMPYLTPPVSPVLSSAPAQQLINPQTAALASGAAIAQPPVNAVPQRQRRSSCPTVPAAQPSMQVPQQSAKKRPRKPLSSQLNVVEEILQLAKIKIPQDFEAILPYQPNMARKKPSKDMTPAERALRERNNSACRKSRRKKLLMKLIERSQNEANSME